MDYYRVHPTFILNPRFCSHVKLSLLRLSGKERTSQSPLRRPVFILEIFDCLRGFPNVNFKLLVYEIDSLRPYFVEWKAIHSLFKISR